MRKRFARPAVAAAVLVLVGLTVFLAVVMSSSSTSARGQLGFAFKKGDPDAVAVKNSQAAVGPN